MSQRGLEGNCRADSTELRNQEEQSERNMRSKPRSRETHPVILQ